MVQAQSKRGRGGSPVPRVPLAKAGEMSVGAIGKLVKEKGAERLASAAVVQTDPAVRKAAIKGLVRLESVPGLKYVLKESESVEEAKMAAYALMTLDCRRFVLTMAGKDTTTAGTLASVETVMRFGNPYAVISTRKKQGDTTFLKAIAMVYTEGEVGNAAIEALRELDSVGELSDLLVQVRSALSGQNTGIGIVGSAEQLERGMKAVAALEELGAVDELQMNAKGSCNGRDAQTLRASINEAVSRLQ